MAKKIDYFINRIEEQTAEINKTILQEIGFKVKLIGRMTPTQAMQVINILKYGDTYDNIRRELAKITKKSYKEIDNMFYDITRENQYFSKKFYEYRGLEFVPLSKNESLKAYVDTFANIAKNRYERMLNSNLLGYGFMDDKGNYTIKGIQETINDVVDKAVLSITQGKTTYQQEMRNTLKQLGGSGLRVISSKTYIDKEGNVRNYSRRLDSSVRMYLLDTARDFSNNMQMKFGQEYGADGVEISVHENPAPDHALIQGRQFTNKEFIDIQAGKYGRAIGEYNCYHYIFTVILGVSKPIYTEEQLQEMQESNLSGFEFQGRKYTMYEGTQLQRRFETEIRKQKDTQILARASGDKELIADAQSKITLLTNKYNRLCNESGLKSQKQRASVSGYRRVKI